MRRNFFIKKKRERRIQINFFFFLFTSLLLARYAFLHPLQWKEINFVSASNWWRNEVFFYSSNCFRNESEAKSLHTTATTTRERELVNAKLSNKSVDENLCWVGVRMRRKNFLGRVAEYSIEVLLLLLQLFSFFLIFATWTRKKCWNLHNNSTRSHRRRHSVRHFVKSIYTRKS